MHLYHLFFSASANVQPCDLSAAGWLAKCFRANNFLTEALPQNLITVQSPLVGDTHPDNSGQKSRLRVDKLLR
jgi:hypothetical protein